MSWFDAGVNLLDSRFDVEDVISRAVNAGVKKLCIITTHPNEWDAAKALYERYPDTCCYTVGVHPHNAKDVTDDDLKRLKQLAQHDGVVAIGECGLDFNRNFSPKDTQISVFNAQLSIAVELEMPVYLHERDAFTQQVECLRPVLPHLKAGIAHCFTGTHDQMKSYIDMGLFIGITGWVCDEKRGQDLRDAVMHLPLERLIIETDAPYLYPKTLKPRKRNNEPAFLLHIGEQLSALMGVSTQVLQDSSYANTCKLFSLQR